MVELRRPHAVTIARTGTTLGDRVHHPPQPPCDTCGQRVSVYNATGRCHACAHSRGYPEPAAHAEEPGPRRGHKKLGHLPNCECHSRRRPELDADGNQKIRGERTRVWLVDVTCPMCHAVRAVRTDSPRAHLCVTKYEVYCYPCSATAEVRRAVKERMAAA